MKIKDIEKLTGLTQKAIRLYESKGLISVGRAANAYRDYDEKQVEQLQLIRHFREAGIGLSDIRLWADKVLSARELLQKRLHELKSETGRNREQVRLCQALLSDAAEPSGGSFDETDEWIGSDQAMALGIDIGTTTISAALVEAESGRQVEAFTLPNDASIPHPTRREQDAGRIFERVEKLLDSVLAAYPRVCAIGLTGQMHGILYVGEQGRAVSNLITWQDARADEELCREIGFGTRPGYGMATHVYNARHGLVPQGARSLCTIMDYAAMRLCGLRRPVIHPSNAASLGGFADGAFQLDAQGMIWPDIAEGLVGAYHGIPVAAAIGDNQASFFGAVGEAEGTVLVNYGTGSQMSLIDPEPDKPLPALLERRPYVGGRMLLCGSALCGGRAYAILERFFRLARGEESAYDWMNAQALQALDAGVKPLSVTTTFCGTREDPSSLGRIEQIGEKDLTPQSLVLGTLQGMAEELHHMLMLTGHQPTRLVASGNAVQKNEAFQQVLEQVFELPVELSTLREEAAVGAARFALRMKGV